MEKTKTTKTARPRKGYDRSPDSVAAIKLVQTTPPDTETLVSAIDGDGVKIQFSPVLKATAAARKKARRGGDISHMLKVRDRQIGIAVARINKHHAYLERDNEVLIVTRTLNPVSKEVKLLYRSRKQLMELYDNKPITLPKLKGKDITFEKVNPIKLWAYHPARRELKGVENAPGIDLGPDYLNMWGGWGTEPKRNADGSLDFSGDGCKRFLRHIRVVWCKRDMKLFTWVVAWLADIIQHPTRKKGKAVMLVSGQGTGKSFPIEHYLAHIVGGGYGYEDTTNFLTRNFNASSSGKLLIYGDEFVFQGDKATNDRLKSFITKEKDKIEEKGKDSYVVDHHTRLIASTNHSHALNLENDDRRWLILDVSDEHKNDIPYFEAFKSEAENGGPEALHAYLMNPALLQDINLRELPETAAAVGQKIHSLQSVEAFLYECLVAGTVQLSLSDDMRQEWSEDGVKVGKGDLHKAYLEYCKAQKDNYPARDSVFAQRLQKVIPSAKDTRSGSGPRQWVLPALSLSRQDFATWIKCPDEDAALKTLWPDYVPNDGCSDVAEIEQQDTTYASSESYEEHMSRRADLEIPDAPDDQSWRINPTDLEAPF